MKHLCLLRHAKAKRKVSPDFERPLAKRGRKAMPLVARWMARKAIHPDLVLCSPARRTVETWELLRRGLSADCESRLLQSLYAASPSRLLARIRAVPDEIGNLLVIGHNPGLENLARDLAASDSDEKALATMMSKFPTAALAVFETDIEAWGDLRAADATLLHFIRPADLA